MSQEDSADGVMVSTLHAILLRLSDQGNEVFRNVAHVRGVRNCYKIRIRNFKGEETIKLPSSEIFSGRESRHGVELYQPCFHHQDATGIVMQ